MHGIIYDISMVNRVYKPTNITGRPNIVWYHTVDGWFFWVLKFYPQIPAISRCVHWMDFHRHPHQRELQGGPPVTSCFIIPISMGWLKGKSEHRNPARFSHEPIHWPFIWTMCSNKYSVNQSDEHSWTLVYQLSWLEPKLTMLWT